MNILKMLVLASFMIAGNASAYYVVTADGSQDIGDVDTFLAAWDSHDPDTYNTWYTGDATGDALETEITSGILGYEVTLTGKTTGDNPGDPEQITAYQVYYGDGEEYVGFFAFELDFGPGHYLIKNAGSNPDTALFENNADSNWGFLNYVDTGINNLTGLVISHVTEFDGTVTVPEPATLALLILGLLGIGSARRLQK